MTSSACNIEGLRLWLNRSRFKTVRKGSTTAVLGSAGQVRTSPSSRRAGVRVDVQLGAESRRYGDACGNRGIVATKPDLWESGDHQSLSLT